MLTNRKSFPCLSFAFDLCWSSLKRKNGNLRSLCVIRIYVCATTNKQAFFLFFSFWICKIRGAFKCFRTTVSAGMQPLSSHLMGFVLWSSGSNGVTRDYTEYFYSCSKPNTEWWPNFQVGRLSDYLTGAPICRKRIARAHLIFHATSMTAVLSLSACLKDDQCRANFPTFKICRQEYAHTVVAVYLLQALIVWVLAWVQQESSVFHGLYQWRDTQCSVDKRLLVPAGKIVPLSPSCIDLPYGSVLPRWTLCLAESLKQFCRKL